MIFIVVHPLIYSSMHKIKRRRSQFIRAELTRLSACVRARASDVCVGNFSQRATVPPTIPSILYARLVPLGSPYIESWYVRFNENARVGGNA